eukprot:325238-Alexandrium_andersonii.AAC.1
MALPSAVTYGASSGTASPTARPSLAPSPGPIGLTGRSPPCGPARRLRRSPSSASTTHSR